MAAQNATQPLDKIPDNHEVRVGEKIESEMIRAKCSDCNRDLGFWKNLKKNFIVVVAGRCTAGSA